MKQIYRVFGCMVVFSLYLIDVSGAILYVQQGANGVGLSWQNPLGDLQVALLRAQPGDQIWVAAGTYKPATVVNRSRSFSIPDGVELYGGFSGVERSLEERNWTLNPTILSGNIGQPGPEDNAYTVVMIAQGERRVVLDGFIISGGRADATGGGTDRPEGCGGGLFIDAAYVTAQPIIQNCIFRDNYAMKGGAIYLRCTNGICLPRFLNCHFISNNAKEKGGALYNNGKMGKCSPQIRGAVFAENRSYYGGAIFNDGEGGSTRPLIQHTQFRRNSSLVRGSAIYNHKGETGVCYNRLENNSFENNPAGVGGPISGTF